MAKRKAKTDVNPDARIHPRNLEAEQAVLGTFFLNEMAVAGVQAILLAEDFYDPRNKEIYRIILELLEGEKPVDAMIVINRLDAEGKLDKVGGPSYITGLEQAVISPDNVRHHAEIVLEKALLRRCIEDGEKQIEAGLAEMNLEKLLKIPAELIDNVSKRCGAGRVLTMKDMAPDIYKEIVADSEDPDAMLPTGFAGLDASIGGLRPGMMFVLAARQSVGKSAFALRVLRNLIARGKAGLLISLEMMARMVFHRVICAESSGQINMDHFKTLPMHEDTICLIGKHLDLMEERFGITSDGATPNKVRAHCLNFRAMVGRLDLVVVDYVQLMDIPGHRGNRQTEVAKISRSIKLLALSLSVPIIAICQLSRLKDAAEIATNDMRISDLRESGALENDADIVLFLNRPPGTDRNKVVQVVEWRIMKGRDTGVSQGAFFYNVKQQLFETKHM